jgi:hypothetical protein
MFKIPDVVAGHVLDLGPTIDPPFAGGVTFQIPDRSIPLTDFPGKPVPGVKEKTLERARRTAESDSAVMHALGQRSEFIGAGILDQKGANRPDLRVVWYSYDTNQTVEAIVDDGGAILREVRVSSSQPPLTYEEEQRANEIVTASKQLPLAENGRGIIVGVADPKSPRSSHRQVDLRFDPKGTRLPRWWAVVDLTANELVEAGEVPGGDE